MSGGPEARWSGWLAAVRRLGLFLLLAGFCAALGLAIAWPLWLFATTVPGTYTICALSLLGAGILFIIARAVLRRRRAPQDPAHPRPPVLAALLGVVSVIVGLAGAYAAAVLLARRLWILGGVSLAAWSLVLWGLSAARRALKKRKPPANPAENGGG